ncbi:N-acetyl sugar amidotransferase [Candidatus Pelagibacter sp. HIMB1782]|uniref:N-acetyl sugar amidotransferase n=1 Tax=Candidatus Pelagibacter sp. HIMB1782 TaxID=3413375 RepID=UPI003F8305EA
MICKNCLTLNTSSNFFLNGTCSACLNFNQRKNIDWDLREKKFNTIFKKNINFDYDCVIPVSGGKDSTYQVIKLLETGCKPLAVCVNTGHMSKIGKINLENLRSLGVELLNIQFSKQLSNELSRIGLIETGDIEWIENMAINCGITNITKKLKINKILWGENSQNEYGGPSNLSESYLLNYKIWLKKFGGQLNLDIKKISQKYKLKLPKLFFNYLPYNEIKKIKSIYLGYFFKWDGFENYNFVKKYGFRSSTQRVRGSILKYENIDNYHDGIHDYFRFLKIGMGRTHDQVSRLIRRKKISKVKGVELIKKYDGEFPDEYLGVKLETILKEINLTKKQFIKLCVKYTNWEIFDKKNTLIRQNIFRPKLKSKFML